MNPADIQDRGGSGGQGALAAEPLLAGPLPELVGVTLRGYVPLRRMPARVFRGLALTLDGQLVALDEKGDALPRSSVGLSPDADGPWSMIAGRYGTVLYPVNLRLQLENGVLPASVEVHGRFAATTDVGEEVRVFSRVEQLSAAYP